MPKASPSSSTNYQVISNGAIFLLLHTSVLFLGASVCFCFQFVLFCLLCYTCWILVFMFGRETRSTFSLEYSCASLILVEYSCLVAVIAVSSQFFMYLLLELSVSFEESTLLLHLYLFGELSNKLIGVWLDQKNVMHVVVV